MSTILGRRKEDFLRLSSVDLKVVTRYLVIIWQTVTSAVGHIDTLKALDGLATKRFVWKLTPSDTLIKPWLLDIRPRRPCTRRVSLQSQHMLVATAP